MTPRAGQAWLERILSRNRYVLGLALLLSVVLPELVQGHVKHYGTWFAEVTVGALDLPIFASAIAVGIGHVLVGRLSLLPLVAARSIIVPTFTFVFGAVAITFLAAQVPIGRYHMWTGFVMATAWYLLVAVLRNRYLRPQIAMIGLAPDFANELPGNVDWVVLRQPRLPSRVSAAVVDPHASLDLPWSRFITNLVLAGVPVYHRAHFEAGLTGRVRFESHADNDFGALLPSLAYLKAKRLFDLVLYAALMPLLLPVILVAAVLIKLESPGGAFFRQLRMGHRGRPFICFKLRTMRSDVDGPSFTSEADPRVTRLGRYLRQWRIDELPQIFNVLRGEMSWIGPRPEALDLANYYAEHVPFYHYRHAVRPGITGWAAVHQGNVGDVDAARMKLEYDFFYIRHFSASLDFLVVLKTLRTIWSGFGSR